MTIQTRSPAYGEGRRALITAAVSLVAREGLPRLTYRSLAAEAQVTTGAIQHHFESLDHVLEEALSYALEVTLDPIINVTSPDDFYAQLVDVVREYPDLQAFQMEMILHSRRHPHLAAYVKDVYRVYIENTAEALALLGLPDDEDFTQLAAAVGDGIIFQLIALGPDQAPKAEAQVRGLSRLFSAYVTAARAEPVKRTSPARVAKSVKRNNH